MSTFLIIAQVSRGFNQKNRIFSSLANDCKYLHVKIASLATVNPVLPWIHFLDGKCMVPCYCRALALDLSACTVDTSMMTFSSCGVKIQ